MTRILLGLSLVAISVVLSMATLVLWYQNLLANPTLAWIIFGIGFSLVSAAALFGVWNISRGIKIDRDDGT
jgi:hypothetical protein